MNLNKQLIDKLVEITSYAAVACHKHIGKNDKVIAKNIHKKDDDLLNSFNPYSSLLF